MRMPVWGLVPVVMVVLLGCGGVGGQRAAPIGDASAPPGTARGRVILATTTSTVDTGLLDELVPVFERQTGYQVVTLSLGSGQALAVGARGEADVLLVHSPDAEAAFMQAGHGVERRLVMHNDFVLVGPASSDPAGVRGAPSAGEALRRIAAARAPFVSRGDQSGTHALELKLWGQAGIRPRGEWYIESGTGMGQTLQIASERDAYTISDRGTYLALRRTLRVDVLLEGDPALRNIYHVILVDPSKNGRINAAGARAFADFLTSADGQRRIGEFGQVRFGQPLFVPDAGKREEDLAR